MHNKLYVIIATAVLVFVMSITASAATVSLMTTDELNARLGEADLVILDVRAEGHWGQSSHKVPGSERVESRSVAQWANNYLKEKPIVLYCA